MRRTEVLMYTFLLILYNTVCLSLLVRDSAVEMTAISITLFFIII